MALSEPTTLHMGRMERQQELIDIITAAELASDHKFIRSLQVYEMLARMVSLNSRGSWLASPIEQVTVDRSEGLRLHELYMKAPKMLQLDEATNALESESERVVQDALNNLMADRIAVVVAHLLTTVGLQDLIAVVKLRKKGMRDEELINIKDDI